MESCQIYCTFVFANAFRFRVADAGYLEGALKEGTRDERLLQLAEKELEAAGEHVHVVLRFQQAPIVLIHLAANFLDLRQVAARPVDSVCLHVLHFALNQLDHFLNKFRHRRLVRSAQSRKMTPKDGLVLPNSLLHQRLDRRTSDEKFA